MSVERKYHLSDVTRRSPRLVAQDDGYNIPFEGSPLGSRVTDIERHKPVIGPDVQIRIPTVVAGDEGMINLREFAKNQGDK